MADPFPYKKPQLKNEPPTVQERQEFLGQIEKPWHKSKKFIAFLIMELLLFTLLFIFIYYTKVSKTTEMTWQECIVAISMVFVMGFIAIAFNGKQATLDQYLRGIALIGQVPTPTTPQGKPKAS